jgi:hypothetical protein
MIDFRPAKRLIKIGAPQLFLKLTRFRNNQKFRSAHGGAEYRSKRALVAQYGLKVIAGPFAGMLYGNDVNCGAYVAKLVGSYEQELHQVVHEIIGRDYRTIVDVGCAEGYYAVGLALKTKSAEIHAFDTDDDAR